MYRKILIATDGSEVSKAAERGGMKLAKSLGSEVVVLNVINEMAISKAIAALVGRGFTEEDLRRTLKDSAEEIVMEATKMGEDSGVRVDPLIREGDPALRILETAAIEGADLILVGCHGEGGITSNLIGSVAQKVLNWSETTVMVVR
ncbi:universal stress protein [Methanotrichaceae archaeon M04Ac]|uniref:Universal stress protein n=1 Tax=Candidatus Methanocrinis alkalitolerans TaxID=3033395 RepID=A0ABT5XBG7_9EURY|nr:universal stress protein [Candidatus Methanocrinis alkalitolerans]MCR3883436.1 universal stress protein [Methanothrix sp.]MDF0591992.1 universal stress protein [Candidatus Methanocrinis alkalitolerans]